MFLQLAIGGLMIGMTVVLHALALDRIIRGTGRIEALMRKFRFRSWKALVIAAVVLAVFAAHIAEMWLWAGLYRLTAALPDMEAALYFSITAFTTLGFGDVVPAHGWRLLGAIEGANGLLLFGWSTAFTFEVVGQLYRGEGAAIRPDHAKTH